jgi:hypothetical protein
MGEPEALVVAESVPHAPAAQLERDHETPAFFGSLDTFAVKVCVWLNWIVDDGGVIATEIVAACGGLGGATENGGSPLGEEERALEFDGIETQPLATIATSRQDTATATGARVAVRTPGSEFKMPVLQCISLREPQ